MPDLIINIATKNGTGSLSSNQILTKSLFLAGFDPASYNFFPSNIKGLPCLYHLRLNDEGRKGFEKKAHILLSLNPENRDEDLKTLREDGIFISDEKEEKTTKTKNHIRLPLSKLSKDFPPTIRPFIKNMLSISFLWHLLEKDSSLLEKEVRGFFNKKKKDFLKENLEALRLGKDLAGDVKLSFSLPKKTRDKNKSLLISGNEASALGALMSNCQFLSWYPITPASSLAETFEKLSSHLKDEDGKKTSLSLQSEDEISALSQAIGASWGGIRSMTCTSGPGLSLMSEGAGLAYFAEIPTVLCNVQRAGPSTGLPTKTMQSDLLSSVFLSHGDTKLITLLPGTVEEAFSFTKKAFFLSEEFQTLVILLSDLDLGMNLRSSKEFEIKEKEKEEEFLKNKDFPFRENEKGVSLRALPGSSISYINKSSGHNEKGEYSEKGEDFTWKLNKLRKKLESAKKEVPPPLIKYEEGASLGFICFGTCEDTVLDFRKELEKKGEKTNFMRVRAYPFSKEVEEFLEKCEEVFVVELNRDGQMKSLLSMECPRLAFKLRSLLQYDGRPLFIDTLRDEFQKRSKT